MILLKVVRTHDKNKVLYEIVLDLIEQLREIEIWANNEGYIYIKNIDNKFYNKVIL